jgi:hypothetical protein
MRYLGVPALSSPNPPAFGSMPLVFGAPVALVSKRSYRGKASGGRGWVLLTNTLESPDQLIRQSVWRSLTPDLAGERGWLGLMLPDLLTTALESPDHSARSAFSASGDHHAQIPDRTIRDLLTELTTALESSDHSIS